MIVQRDSRVESSRATSPRRTIWRCAKSVRCRLTGHAYPEVSELLSRLHLDGTGPYTDLSDPRVAGLNPMRALFICKRCGFDQMPLGGPAALAEAARLGFSNHPTRLPDISLLRSSPGQWRRLARRLGLWKESHPSEGMSVHRFPPR